MLSRNSKLFAVLACLLSIGLGSSDVIAQPSAHPVYLPQIQQAIVELKGEIWDVLSSSAQPNFLAISYNPVAFNPGEVPDFLIISQNKGRSWEQIAARPWEYTGLGPGTRVSYGVIEAASSIELVALVYGYLPDQTQIVDLFLSPDYGTSWIRYPLNIPTACGDQYIRAELLNHQAQLSGSLFVRIYCLVPVFDSAPRAISFTAFSRDRGQHWTLLPNQPTEGAYTTPSPAAESTLFLLGSDGHISTSNDGGQTWIISGTAPAGILSFSEVSPERIAMVSSSPGQLSLDTGMSWREWRNLDCPSTNTGTSYVEVRKTGVVGYLICGNGAVYESANDWLSWKRIATVPVRRAGNFGLIVDQATPTKLFVLEYGVGGGMWLLDTSTSAVVPLIGTTSPFTP